MNGADMLGYGWMGGGGGIWVQLLVVLVVIFVAAWILKQVGK